MIDTVEAMEINEERRDNLQEILRVYQDYNLGLEKTKEFLCYLKKNNGCDYDFSFAYYMMAIFYKELNNINFAISNLKKANEYNIEKDERMKNISVEADLYEHLASYKNKEKNIKIAIKLYKKCYEYFNKKHLNQHCSILLCNIGHLTHNEIMIRQGIKIYKKLIDINLIEQKNVLQVMNSYLESTITYNKNK